MATATITPDQNAVTAEIFIAAPPARVFQAIRHVNVRMISQGASEINMSFMIEEDDVEEAVRSLHEEFFADPDPEIFDVEAVKEAVR